jgi:tryptophan synthase beta chain
VHHTISEAVEVAAQDPEIRYALGSVLNHVLLHQTIIGEEALLQLAKAGERAPDLIVGCTGGGSNFAGLSFPFLREKLAGRMSPTIRAVGLMEAVALPQTECFTAGVRFARSEGIVAAPEPTHAIAAAVREAARAKETGEETVILTAVCGHGQFDLAAYDDFLHGRLVDEDVTEARLAAGLATVPAVG